jgi:Tol biopolymer transport system component
LGWARDLAFRRDGSSLTFAVERDPDGFWELHDVPLASGREIVLFPVEQGHHNYPSWSSDGRLAYYSKGPDGAYESVDGAFLLQGNDPGRVAWTANGALIATFGTATSPGDLILADPATQALTPLVTGTGGEIYDQPALSPDGTKIAYVRRGVGPAGKYEEELWIANADGQGQVRLTTGSDDGEPAWSGDGRSVLFNRFNQGLVLYDLATATEIPVTAYPADSIAWSP